MTARRALLVTTLATLPALALGACGAAEAPAEDGERATAEALAAADVVVYKTPTCGCCTGWAEHMRENGFTVAEVDVGPNELSEKKVELGVPMDLGSCHTARVGDYLVEGHVPARVVRRMIEEQPSIAGVAVRGMPIGSPGMEGPNPQPYDVIAFGEDGRTVYESVDPR